MRDATVAQPDQMLNGGDGPRIVIGDDGIGRDGVGVAVDQHEGEARRDQRLYRGILSACRGDEQAIHLPPPQHVDAPLLACRLVVGIGQDHAIAAGRQRVFDAAEQNGEERIGDVGDRRADDEAAFGAQGARQMVGLIAMFAGQREDAPAHFLADALLRIVVEHPCDSRGMHSRQSAELFQCHSHTM